MRKLLSLLSTLFLFLASNVAFADSDSLSSFLSSPAIANKTDLSVSYLDQVFGTVGNVLTGTSGQMLGHLFYQLNNGILIVAGMWLSYTVATIAIKAAQEGSFMSQNKQVSMTYLKISLGMSLLIPYGPTGYSLLQDITMKIVVEGVGLADEIWNAGLDYINNGGVVWHDPSDSGSDTGGNSVVNNDSVNAFLGKATGDASSSTDPGMGQVIFSNLVCMYASRDKSYVDSGDQKTTYYDIYEDDSGNRFNFQGNGDGLSGDLDSATGCGSVSWNLLSGSLCTAGQITADTGDTATIHGSSEDAMCAAARNAVYNMTQDLEPAAYNYYCQHAGSDSQVCAGNDTSSTSNAENANYFFNAMVNYVNAVMPIASKQQNGAGHTDNFIKQAEKEGWLSAGRYYWDLSRTTAEYENISNVNNYVPSALSMPMADGSLPGNADLTPLLQSATYIGASSNDADTVRSMISDFNGAQASGSGGSGYSPQTDGVYWTLQVILGDFFGNLESLISRFGQGNIGVDPIAFLSGIGQTCIRLASSLWFGVGISFSLLMVATIGCKSMVDTSDVFKQAISWVQPLFMALAGMLVGVGAILGYYVPLYPYMLFTFGVIGWIIAVIEAMVAAPLVCFGLTHPEGHDFLGEAKQALMLLLGIFLRPALMVVGMVAGMIVSYVSLRILIYTFSGICSDMFASSPAQGAADGNVYQAANNLMANSFSGQDISLSGIAKTVLVFPITLIIFTSMVYGVVTQSFSLIYVLPDYIMRWIGGPVDQHRNGPAQLAGQVQSAVSSGASGLGQGMSSAQSGLKQERDRQSTENKNSAEGPSGGASSSNSGGSSGGGS